MLAPTLTIVPAAAKLPAADGLAAILVTSGNALAAFSPAYFASLMLTVGDATAAKARQAGFTRVVSADGDATDLAGLVSRQVQPAAGPLLLASGQGQGHALAATLRQAGYRVIRRVAYRAARVPDLPQPVTAALAAGQVRAAMFFSAETARHFVRLIRRARLGEALRHSDAVAIGRAAGVALTALPWRRISVAAKPNQDEMLALLR